MASVVEIVNSALNLLGASTITALTDDSKNARICNQRYEPIRNRIFRSHPWNCLLKNSGASENWYIHDTMRGWPVSGDAQAGKQRCANRKGVQTISKDSQEEIAYEVLS